MTLFLRLVSAGMLISNESCSQKKTQSFARKIIWAFTMYNIPLVNTDAYWIWCTPISDTRYYFNLVFNQWHHGKTSLLPTDKWRSMISVLQIYWWQNTRHKSLMIPGSFNALRHHTIKGTFHRAFYESKFYLRILNLKAITISTCHVVHLVAVTYAKDCDYQTRIIRK